MPNAVFLSASLPDSRADPDFARTADAVAIGAAVSALVYVTLGRRVLVWGGHPAITPMVRIVAEDLGVEYGHWVKLYQTSYFEDRFPEDNERFHNVVYTENVDHDRERSLAHMRQRMFQEQSFDAAVFIGGMRGVIEECGLIRNFQPKAKLLPIASTGGAALTLAERLMPAADALINDLDYISVFHRYLRIREGEERFPNPDDQPRRIKDRFRPRPKKRR